MYFTVMARLSSGQFSTATCAEVALMLDDTALGLDKAAQALLSTSSL